MSLKTFRTDFKDYITTITGRQVIKAEGKGPQPKDPYITIKVDSADPLDHDIDTTICDEQAGTIQSGMRGLTKVEFQIVALGGEVMDELRKLKTSLWSSKFLDILGEKGFGLSDVGAVTNTSAIFINSKFEDRAQLICSFYTSFPETFDVDHFESTEFTLEEDNLPYSKTFTVPEP